MPTRLPEPAPVLPGYTVVRPLGSGGFADVFLYEQSLPRRRVAVKVLLPEAANDDARRMFLAEATLMAQLSAHPDVLTVYEANVAPDGRPYLVMEYCPDSYGSIFRDAPLPVTEVLQIAVAVGSVLETAHRDGFLHRDVKPSNILRTSYGRPVLADFGIAATLAEAEFHDARGLSVPWSAPEIIRGTTTGTIRSEVYSYAATVYGLLAGRSPFEIPSGDNSLEAVERRILGRAAVPPTGRTDVPRSLESTLARALAKDPEHRQTSVLSVLRALQLVESELGMRPSPLLLPGERVVDSRDEWATGADPLATGHSGENASRGSSASEGARRPRNRSRSRNTGTGSTRTAATRASAKDTRSTRAASLRQSPKSAAASTPRIDATVVRTASSGPSGRAQSKPGALSGRRPVVVGTSILAALVVVAAIFVVGGLRAGAAIPVVATISANSTSDAVQFTWNDPGLRSGDSYLVRVDGGSGADQRSTTFTLDRSELQGPACITVTVIRDGRNGSPSTSTCAGG